VIEATRRGIHVATTFERYQEDGIRIDQYVEKMENNKAQFVQNIEQSLIRDEHQEFFADQALHFLVITEDWCIDSVQFIPVLARLAQDNKDIDIRVLRRDENTDLAEQYPRKDGYNAIPVVVIFDSDGNELGSIVERPEQASKEMAEETRKFQEANPDLDGIKRNIDRMPEETQEKVKGHSRRWRMTQQDRFTDLMLEEVREVIESAEKQSAA
jgi:thiol-disulfide isomerase/thioredoxin